MKVVCIFPVAFNLDKAPEILTKFQKEIAPTLETLGAIQPEIKFAGTDYVFVGINQVLEGEPKGKGILESIKNCSSNPNFVIVCDGSSKIPYSYIINIFQELVSDTTICCVMANRIENKAISPFRYLIERFEIYSIKRFHHYIAEIPDGQCGLWGFRYGKLSINGQEKEIELTAEGYEIELDLLTEVIKHKLNHSFIDVELPQIDVELPQVPSSTSFTFENNLKKMEFLIKKCSNIEKYFPDYFKDFEYIQEFRELCDNEQIKADWENYKKQILLL